MLLIRAAPPLNAKSFSSMSNAFNLLTPSRTVTSMALLRAARGAIRASHVG
jgi:hypothetical protein